MVTENSMPAFVTLEASGIRTSETIGTLAGALAKAQARITPVVAAETAKVRMKAGGEYSYKYAHLAAVLDACRLPIAENGLALVQFPRLVGDFVVVTTLLVHASGEYLSSDLALRPDTLAPQSIGSAITYARRYSVLAMIGIAPEEDDDGQAAQPRENSKGGRTTNVRPPGTRSKPAPSREERVELARKALEGVQDLATFEKYDNAIPGRFPDDDQAQNELRSVGNISFYRVLTPAIETMNAEECRKWLAWVPQRTFIDIDESDINGWLNARLEEVERQEAESLA